LYGSSEFTTLEESLYEGSAISIFGDSILRTENKFIFKK
jgi:hypothetical protein